MTSSDNYASCLQNFVGVLEAISILFGQTQNAKTLTQTIHGGE
jgi:hypothetical protein